MHPGWWGFFGLLGVLVVVGLVASIVQGVWFVIGAVFAGAVLLGLWGLWEARWRPDWRRVVLSDAVPSDAGVRAAAVERIRAERGERSKRRRWWDGWMAMTWLVGLLGVFSVWALGFTVQALMLLLLLVGSWLSAWVVCVGVWWLGRRTRWGRVLGFDADDAEDLEDGAGDADAREEARLLAWATARAVHRRAVLSTRNGMMLVVFAFLFVLGYLLLLRAGGVSLPPVLLAWTGQLMGWLVMLPLTVMAGELLNHTDGARRSAVRESERLLYGEVSRVPGWRRGRVEMEEMVRVHREGRRES